MPSFSSQLISQVTIARNPQGEDINWKDQESLFDSPPSVGVRLVSEAAYAVLALSSIVEAVAVSALAIASLPFALVSTRPLGKLIVWIESSVFSAVWSFSHLLSNVTDPNLVADENHAKKTCFGGFWQREETFDTRVIINVNRPTKSTFVSVLNNRKYYLGNKTFEFEKASEPKKVKKESRDLQELKAQLYKTIPEDLANDVVYSVVDQTTEEAIENRNDFSKIALNFANEHHAGGGPSCYLDPETNQFKFLAKSARAQEESLVKHTDLMDSLTQLPHIYEQRSDADIARSFYLDPFNSEEEAFISDNTLFALRDKADDGQYKDFEALKFVEPVKVSFVTSAAKHLGKGVKAAVGDSNYQSQYQRIEAHLKAAAVKALELKEKSPNEQPVELILGAFGCGAFSPSNKEEYATWTAEIYKELLADYAGFFDQVTFAVPKFGISDDSKVEVINFNSFKNVFEDI